VSYVPDDTAPEIEAELALRLAALTGAERVAMVSDLCETARQLIFASRPDIRDERGRRRLLLERLYPELQVPEHRLPR
jgi:hypothetical protein